MKLNAIELGRGIRGLLWAWTIIFVCLVLAGKIL